MENDGKRWKTWKTVQNVKLMKKMLIWTFVKLIFLIILRRYFNSSIQIFVFQKIVLHAKKMLILRGNTIMIDDLDTLSCDSMYYWTSLDSGFAMGNVRFVQPSKNRKLF